MINEITAAFLDQNELGDKLIIGLGAELLPDDRIVKHAKLFAESSTVCDTTRPSRKGPQSANSGHTLD